MMNNSKNNNNKVRTEKQLSISLLLAIVSAVALVSGTTATMNVFAVSPQALPTCTDPTGENLPCMMVISTLSPPASPVQCQESSGQILTCSYATQILSNGQQIVVITVYVPANFIFSGGPVTVVKVVHETTTKIIRGGPSPYTLSVSIKVVTDPIVRGHMETIRVTVSDKSNPSMKIAGAKVSGELFYAIGSHKPISCTTTNQNGESQCSSIIGPNSTPGTFKITVQVSTSGYKTASKSATFTVIPKTNTTTVTNTTIPINVTNSTSPSPTNISSMISNLPSNTSAINQRTNTSVPKAPSGGKGTGSTCAAGNCTTGTTPATVDCTKNPTDPSCASATQTLTPPSTTQTCPDGSTIPATDKCPIQSTTPTNPNTPSTPPSTSGTSPPATSTPPPPPASNNPSPPSGNNNPSSGESGGGGSGGGNGANQNGRND